MKYRSAPHPLNKNQQTEIRSKHVISYDHTIYHKPSGDGNTVLMTALSLILLAFFILLYAMSSPNKTKQLEIAFEIKEAFESIGGILGSTGDSFQTGRGVHKESLEVSSNVESFLQELAGYTEKDPDLKNFSYEVTNEEMLLHIPTDFAFPLGSAQIKNKAFPFLEKIYDVIAKTENKVRIEGHTDDIPFQNQYFDSNWELSAMRAMSVLRHFTNKNEIPIKRFSAAGYGSHRPIASNRFSEGREKNRRVTVILINPLERLGGPLGTGK